MTALSALHRLPAFVHFQGSLHRVKDGPQHVTARQECQVQASHSTRRHASPTPTSRRAEHIYIPARQPPKSQRAPAPTSIKSSAHSGGNPSIVSPTKKEERKKRTKDNMSEPTATPRITAQYLEQFSHQTVRVLGKVRVLAGEEATIDAGGQIRVILSRVCLFLPFHLSFCFRIGRFGFCVLYVFLGASWGVGGRLGHERS